MQRCCTCKLAVRNNCPRDPCTTAHTRASWSPGQRPGCKNRVRLCIPARLGPKRAVMSSRMVQRTVSGLIPHPSSLAAPRPFTNVWGRCPRRHLTVVAKRGNLAAAAAAAKPRKIPTVDKIEWQQPLQVLKYPDPRLRAVNARVGVFDDNLRELAKQMLKVMYEDDGVGLAAPQVGVNIRLMVFNETARPGDPAETVLVNPTIIEKSKLTDFYEEGCLSFPKLYGDVERPKKIAVRYQNLEGTEVEMELSGFPARVFQHEYDHLQGVLYFERMKSGVLETLRPSLVGLEEAYLAANPGAAIQRLPPPSSKVAAKSKGFGAPK